MIGHHEARIYRSATPGAVPQQIRPHAPDGFRCRPAGEGGAGDRSGKNELPGFFEPVAGVLNGAGRILVFDFNPGPRSEMVPFVVWLKGHRPELAARIIDSVAIPGSRETEAQLLARARKIFSGVRSGSPARGA